MPTVVRNETDERDALLAYLESQRAGVRRAVLGLDDEQAASRPSASELNLAGLVKHVARTEETWVQGLLLGRAEKAGTREDYVNGFRLLEGETLAGWLDAWSAIARETEAAVLALPDLEGTVALPDAPWNPPGMKVSARWILLHLIEETARHAGHADIVRESLDGRTAFELVDLAAREGRPMG
ncbi:MULTISPECIES: DinB family protein [unclassified Streptomyces]|uniref:DinB family protein n=1 Tax=unclassified Streptomyces TaxID=2593676 RepID=UPI00380AE9D0